MSKKINLALRLLGLNLVLLMSACSKFETSNLSSTFLPSQFQAALQSAGSSGGNPFRIVDSQKLGFDYAYGPTIIKFDNTYYAYYCSTGTGAQDWDHVRMSTSPNMIDWSVPTTLLKSTPVERANCDPSVVRHDAGDGLFFYMVYSGNAVNIQTLNFVARSVSPSGPFLKYTDRGTWEENPRDPHAIIFPSTRGFGDNSGVYGAGQPSLVVKSGVVYQWFNDTTSEPNHGPHIFLTKSNNLTNWSQPIATNVNVASVDVKYDDSSGVFYMFQILNEHLPNAKLAVQTSPDGISWSDLRILCDENCFPDWANNIGVSGDHQGHLLSSEVLVAYGAPNELKSSYNNDCKISAVPYCWGFWSLYGQFVDLSIRSSKATCSEVPQEPAECSHYVGQYGIPIGATQGMARWTINSCTNKITYTGGCTGSLPQPAPAQQTNPAPRPAAPAQQTNPAPQPAAAPAPQADPVPRTASIYELFNGVDYFETSLMNEGTSFGYRLIGVTFNVYASQYGSTSIPVFRCYVRHTGDHFVSTSSDCEGQYVEGLFGYILSIPKAGHVPLSRYINPVTGDHLTTAGAGAVPSPYIFEGTLGYSPQ